MLANLRFCAASYRLINPCRLQSGDSLRKSPEASAASGTLIRRETRARRAWTGARTSPHAFRAATGSSVLCHAQSGGLARCAKPGTIHREAGANGTRHSRLAARSQPGASEPRARARAMRRSTTVGRETRPCLLRNTRGTTHVPQGVRQIEPASLDASAREAIKGSRTRGSQVCRPLGSRGGGDRTKAAMMYRTRMRERGP